MTAKLFLFGSEIKWHLLACPLVYYAHRMAVKSGEERLKEMEAEMAL